MPADITLTDLQRALDYLASIPGHDPESGDPLALILPEDTFPWPDADGNEQLPPLWQDAWEKYDWNPNLNENKSPKPHWDTISHAIALTRALAALDAACSARITAAYGAKTTRKEQFDRLRAMEPDAPADLVARITTGNTTRDHHRTRHAKIKTWLHTLTNPTDLDNLNLIDPTYWANTWTPSTPP